MTTFVHQNYPTSIHFDESVVRRRDVGAGGGEKPQQKKKKPPLKRQSTFTLDDEEDQKEDLLSGTHHAGGIRAILERANEDFVFPDEVKAYISSHFRMIREENDSLRKGLKEKSRQLDKMAKEHQNCGETARKLDKTEKKLKTSTDQLEKEKAKAKNMAKRIKEMSGNGDDLEASNGVLWYGVKPPGAANNNNNNRDAQSPPDEQGYFSRPPSSLATIDLDESSDKRNPDRKLKILRTQVQTQKEELDLLKEILLRELGSPSAVKQALNTKESSWRGREEQIQRLEESLESLRTLMLSNTSKDTGSETDNQIHLRCRVAEVERDRLNEYVKVVSSRFSSAEELLSKSESRLREERRKTAKLERMVEKAHLIKPQSNNSSRMSASHSSLPTLSNISANNGQADEEDMRGEIEALRQELELSKRRRDDDLEMYLNMASDIKKAVNSDKTEN